MSHNPEPVPPDATRLARLAGTPLLEEVWQHFPEHMFLIRVQGPDDFVVEATNPAHQATLGSHVDGCRLTDILPAETARKVHNRYRECLAKKSPMRYEEHAHYNDASGVARFGYWITLLLPLHLEGDGRVSHLFGISQNITELRQANQALEHYNQELEARVAERTRELEAANESLQTLNARLETLATRDHLTGVLNRRHLETLAEAALARAEATAMPLSLLMLDLDNFKEINDTQGHAVGDEALRQVATLLAAGLRDGDLLGRYGGDEFLVLLPDTGIEDATIVAECMQQALAQHTALTASVGITERQPGESDLSGLTRRADERLLQGKRDGRNRIIPD